MPPKKWPVEQLSPTTRYRYAERTADTRRAHADESTVWRRSLAEAELSPERREELLTLIRRGTRVAEAAAQVGVSWQRVYGLAAYNTEFSDALDAATAEACVCGGTPWLRTEGRRRCFCPQARAYRAQEAQEYRDRQKRWNS